MRDYGKTRQNISAYQRKCSNLITGCRYHECKVCKWYAVGKTGTRIRKVWSESFNKEIEPPKWAAYFDNTDDYLPLIMHSAATRLFLSWDRQAVTMASEIWSQILSGCPHETCSLVKIIKKSSFRMYGCVKGWKTHPAKKKEPTENSVDPHRFSGDYNNITSKEKSQCKTSANFSSELTSLFS